MPLNRIKLQKTSYRSLKRRTEQSEKKRTENVFSQTHRYLLSFISLEYTIYTVMFGIKARVSESFSREQNRKRNRRGSSTSFFYSSFRARIIVLSWLILWSRFRELHKPWGIESIALPRKEKLFVPSGALEATRYINLGATVSFFSLFFFYSLVSQRVHLDV